MTAPLHAPLAIRCADSSRSAVSPTGAAPPGAGAGAGPGSGDGLADLFEEHRLWLVRLATLLVDSQDSAEDIVQSAYLGLLRHWRRRDAAQSIAYLRASVVNGCRSALRRRRSDRARRAHLDAEALAALPDAAAGPAAAIELAEQRRTVLDLLARLPRRQREVLVLRYWGDLSETEIAASLGISPGTVKSSASRGIAALARGWDQTEGRRAR